MIEELKPTQAQRDRNEGHGHVFLRPDGVRMRCGGAGLCKVCSVDLAKLQRAWSTRPPAALHAENERLRTEVWNEAIEVAAVEIAEPISAYVYDVLYKLRMPVISHTHQNIYEKAQAAIRALKKDTSNG